MCLYVDLEKTKQYKYAEQDGWVFWKIVTKKREPYLQTRSKIVYSKGKTIRVNVINKEQYDSNQKINAGIHVCTYDPFPVDQGLQVIKVLCYKKNLLAVGRYRDAVFNAVTVLT